MPAVARGRTRLVAVAVAGSVAVASEARVAIWMTSSAISSGKVRDATAPLLSGGLVPGGRRWSRFAWFLVLGLFCYAVAGSWQHRLSVWSSVLGDRR